MNKVRKMGWNKKILKERRKEGTKKKEREEGMKYKVASKKGVGSKET